MGEAECAAGRRHAQSEYLVHDCQSHPGFLPSIRSPPTQIFPKKKHWQSGSKGRNQELERLPRARPCGPAQQHAQAGADCTTCIWEVPPTTPEAPVPRASLVQRPIARRASSLAPRSPAGSRRPWASISDRARVMALGQC